MPLSREEIELLSAYEQEMKTLRNQLADGLYWGCRRSLERYQAFVAEFGPEGRYASLAAQYAADSVAISASENSSGTRPARLFVAHATRARSASASTPRPRAPT